MSATGRGADRIASDNYPTPSWCVRRLLESGALPHGGAWYEPCAGEGAIVRALVASGYPDLMVASDVRDCRADLVAAGADRALIDDMAEARAVGPDWRTYNVAITNPPYALAEPVIRNMLGIAEYVAVLVRQGFMASESRAAWLSTDMPDTYDLPNRPSFVSAAKCITKGCTEGTNLVPHTTDRFDCPQCLHECRLSRATDASDYCWLVWTPERNRTRGSRVILPCTPLAERRLP